MDYVSSSRATALFGNAAIAARKAELEALVYGSREGRSWTTCKNTGDGYFMTFASAGDALALALAVLKGLPNLNADLSHPDLKIRLRIGITFGELQVTATGERLGEAANLCARYEALKGEDLIPDAAGTGERLFRSNPTNRILISGEVYDVLGSPEGILFVGWLQPKGIARRYHVYYVDWRQEQSADEKKSPQPTSSAKGRQDDTSGDAEKQAGEGESSTRRDIVDESSPNTLPARGALERSAASNNSVNVTINGKVGKRARIIGQEYNTTHVNDTPENRQDRR